MLNDLEKRRAFLNDEQDIILDGLYSAYDLELTDRKNRFSPVKSLIVLILIISLSIALTIYLTEGNLLKTIPVNNISSINEVSTGPLQKKPVVVDSNTQETLAETAVSHKEESEVRDKPEIRSFLKLEDDLIVEQPENENEELSNSYNVIESIRFEKINDGLDLVLQSPLEIDYLVYSLNNPDRTVIEIENAKLGFPLEQLEPVDPITAIRYSVNGNKRFKLVLESEKPLSIRKSTTSTVNDVHNLVVTMDYQWDKNIVTNNDEDIFSEIVDQQVQNENNTVFKGALIKTPVGQNNSAYAEKLFKQAYAKYKNGDISSSLKLLNMALDHDAGNVNARSTLALILSQQDHMDLAYSVLNEGLIQYPAQVEWIKMMARLLLKEGKVVEAKEILSKQTPALSTNTDYYALQAAILQKLDEHNKSAKIYRDLLQVNPLNAIWWMGLGISLESMKRYEDALYAYQKASNDPGLANESKSFVSQRLTMLSNLLKDESS